MATIRHGANGGFRGKAGSVIGSSWKSIDYIKGLYKKSTKPATQEQKEQRERFAILMRFLLPITPFLKIGFGQKTADRMTPHNVAYQENSKTAVIGAYPTFELDYSAIRISTGSYASGGTMSVESDQGMLSVTWSTELNEVYDSREDDRVYILLYQPVIDEFLAAPNAPTRGDGNVNIQLPDHFLGEEGHVWIFFTNRNGKKVSKSTYLGRIDLVGG